MTKSAYGTIIGILMSVILLSRCSLDPDKKLNRAIDDYLAQGPGALRALAHEFIRYASVDSLEATRMHSNGNILYTLNENKIEILYPLKLKLAILDGGPVRHAYASKDYCVITDETHLCIFDGEGEHKHDETIGDNKHLIRSVLITGDNIIYCKDEKLYLYNILLNTSEQLISDTFPAPFTQYYKVSMVKTGSFLGVLAGMAGSYNLSVINLSSKTLTAKNIPLSSSKFSLDAAQIFYITGNAGNWGLIQYRIDQKKKKSLEKFNDLLDIELLPAGYVYESKGGLWAAEYGREKTRLPFPYQLSGKYRGRLVIKYNDTYYLINSEKLFAGLMKLKVRAPALINKSAE
jgi:hypothetical protein